jgi:succinoglycan biosynthesis protein ExoL
MTGANRLNVLVLAHDLSDAAIVRRIQMLKTGGAVITVAGFRRTESPIESVGGCLTINFGRTRNGSFAQRIGIVFRTVMQLKHHRALFAGIDVIVARNLEMLTIAVIAVRRHVSPPAIVYEILDLHRLLLSPDFTGYCLRWLERKLLRRTQAIFTSSPGFIVNYFHKINPTSLPIRLIENKVLRDVVCPMPVALPHADRPPWIIGWFGIIRCRRSLQILSAIASQHPDLVSVVIRGRPALDQIPDFYETVAATPNMTFGGPYENPHDLKDMYNAVHFNWTIDLYEEGLNSSWLLPNRIYEGGFYNAVPIADINVATGQYLKNMVIGVLLQQPLTSSLRDFLTHLTPDAYQRLVKAARAVPSAHWVYDRRDCKDLVRYMSGLKPYICGAIHDPAGISSDRHSMPK